MVFSHTFPGMMPAIDWSDSMCLVLNTASATHDFLPPSKQDYAGAKADWNEGLGMRLHWLELHRNIDGENMD